MANNFQSQTDNLSSNQDSSIYQQTAVAVVIVLKVVLYTVIGAAIGGAIWATDCCLLGNNCNWDCISPGVYIGGSLGLVAGIITVAAPITVV